MKNALTITLCLALTGGNLACASMRRHPVLYGMAAGAIIGGTIGLAQRHPCPHTITYEGKTYPYDGTAPCPGPNYDPTGKRR